MINNQLDDIAERIHQSFASQTRARDAALACARMLTRHCANAIRAIHRNETDLASQNLAEARNLALTLSQDLAGYPDLYYAGYTQDSLKEFAEASITCAIIQYQPLPTPEELGLQYATYLQGLAEVIGELRRRCMDILRGGHSQEAERLLTVMDDIFTILVTMDYPDAITGGLRRLTDVARGILERTRGDITISLRQSQLEETLERLEAKFHSQPE